MTPDPAKPAATTSARPPQRWRADALWLLGYVPLAIFFTWPLASRFTTELAGSRDDSWQNLWNMGWLRHALLTGSNPFFTHELWHPDGTTLIFQTFDLPDAIPGALLLGLLGPYVTYNVIVLWTFVASGAAMYLLGRGTGASRWASFLSGCAYTFTTYHFAHAIAHLHLLAMQWLPLYMLAFWRVLEGGRWRWAFAGGAFLFLTSLASWYYLIIAFILSLGAVVMWLLRERGRGLGRFAVRGLVLCTTYLALIAPLGVAMLVERAREPLEGYHPANVFSSDIYSFTYPNQVQWLAKYSNRFQHWTGNTQENGTYLGAILLFLAVVGVLLRVRRVPAYVLAAGIGIAFSLGPLLHIDGRFTPAAWLPYPFVVRHIPLLEFMGVPIRFASAATFGLAASLALVLDRLHRWIPAWVLAPIAFAGVLEHTPKSFETSNWPTPAPLAQWAKNPEQFAVLDGCRDNRHLWHQFLHQHPIFDGYVSRLPSRLQKKLNSDPVIFPIRTTLPPTHVIPYQTARIDFDFREPIQEGAERNHFFLDLQGTLVVEKAGRARFWTLSDDGSTLSVDGRMVVNNGGNHSAREVYGVVQLEAGEHRINIHYEQAHAEAVLRAWWAPDGEPRRLLDETQVPGGFSGKLQFDRRDTDLSREDALAHLQGMHVKYILQPEEDSHYLPERQLGLPLIYRGAGVTIFEVPDGSSRRP